MSEEMKMVELTEKPIEHVEETQNIKVPPNKFDENFKIPKRKKKSKNIKIPKSIVLIHGIITLLALTALVILLFK